MSGNYESVYQSALQDPEGFWARAAEEIHWYKKWDRVLDDTDAPYYRWYTGGEVNTCYNAVDLHVENGQGSSGGGLIKLSANCGFVNLTP